MVYGKDDAGITQLWARSSDGTVHQITPVSNAAGAGGGIFGTGDDGNVTIVAGTTTLARDMFYDTLTMNANAIIEANGFRIFAKTAIVGADPATCIIRRNGANGGNGVAGGGAAGAGGTGLSIVGRPLLGSSDGGAGSSGGVGAVGAAASPTMPLTNNHPTAPNGAAGGDSIAPDNFVGGAGGLSTSITTATPGTGGVDTALWAIAAKTSGLSAMVGPAGGGGGAGKFNGVAGHVGQGASGGGGGSGGGYVTVASPTCSGVTIQAMGGNGGLGAGTADPWSSAGGGGGGAGGNVIAVVGDGSFPAIAVTGGVGGAGANGGTSGGNGNDGRSLLFSNI